MSRKKVDRVAAERLQKAIMANPAPPPNYKQLAPVGPKLSYLQPTVVEAPGGHGSAVTMVEGVVRCDSPHDLAESFADLMLFPPTAVRIAAQWARNLPGKAMEPEAHLRTLVDVLANGQCVLEAKAVEKNGGHHVSVYPFGMQVPHLGIQLDDPGLPPLFLATASRLLTAPSHTMRTSSFRRVTTANGTVKYQDFAYNNEVGARLRRSVLLAALVFVHCAAAHRPGPVADEFPELAGATRDLFHGVLSGVRDRLVQEETVAVERRCAPLDPWQRTDFLTDLRLLIEACGSKPAFTEENVARVLFEIIELSAEVHEHKTSDPEYI